MMPAETAKYISIDLIYVRAVISSLALMLSIFYIFISKWKVNLKPGVFLFFSCYSIFAFFSAIYSVDFYPTFGRGIEVLAISFFALVFFGNEKNIVDPQYLWNFTLLLLALLSIFYISMTFLLDMNFVSDVEGVNQWSGYGGKNSISAISGVFFLVSLNRIIMVKGVRRFIWIALASFSLLFLYLSQSRTTTILVFFVFVPYLAWLLRYKYTFLISVLMITFLIPLFFYELVDLFSRGQSVEQVLALSGRLAIWERAFTLIHDSPIFGYGYYAANQLVYQDEITYGLASSNLDSVFVETMLGLGLIGLFFISCVFISASILVMRAHFFMQNFLTRNESMFFREALLIIVFTIFRSFVNPTIQGLHWNLILFLAASLLLSSIPKVVRV